MIFELFLILFGALVAVIVAVLVKTSRVDPCKKGVTPHIYVNAVVHNKSAVLKEKVKAKLQEKLPMNGPNSFFKRNAAAFANSMVNDQTFTERLAASVAAEAPGNMKREQGLDIDCELIFVKGSYFVLKIDLHKIDSETFIAKKLDDLHRPNLVQRFSWAYSTLIGSGSRKQWLDEKLTELVCGKVQKGIGASMEKKLKLKANAECDITGLLPEHQADFFFCMLQLLCGMQQKKGE